MTPLTDKEIADIMQVYKNALTTTNNVSDTAQTRATSGYMQVVPNSYIPNNHSCPNCGYCPHCGRGGIPHFPYSPPYWYSGPNSITYTMNNGTY